MERKTLTPDIVSAAASKANFDVNRVAAIIKRAQRVSLCFLLDTTMSMKRYIDGVKEQIFQIVSDVERSHCVVAGLAFVGYKGWSNGKLTHFSIASTIYDLIIYFNFRRGPF